MFLFMLPRVISFLKQVSNEVSAEAGFRTCCMLDLMFVC